ncbi:MAG: glucose-1-phosphate adenylyltransferase [Verrucomicrobiales bacterium]|jgi:glucose-1-phosphate adenylyltransferase|nr:glucose-1-phosphate adenylyltransferase [Verrucomicrobiales bacterium]
MEQNFFDSSRVISVILGGGAGTRLFPLTKERAKPAVPLAGKYRLVDIPISLCINSGLKRIFLLTQYLSSSLHRHVYQSFSFDDYYPYDFIDILAATQNSDMTGWYQGTADAVRQNISHLSNHQHDLVLILSGDQLYRMDYRRILAQHVKTGADITVATIPVSREPARGFGIMQVDDNRRITRFVEKPKDDALLDSLRISDATRNRLSGHQAGDLYLASMGIYVFSRKVLEEALFDMSNTDFGRDIIPQAITDKKVFSYIYQGYWEDIGTIKAFYDANLDLTNPVPQFNFYDGNSPIYSQRLTLPASKVIESRVEKAVLSEGSIISNANITHSIIGIRSRIEAGVEIKDSIIMGADFYQCDEDMQADQNIKIPHVGIGANTKISGAIIDKNARIGRNVTISGADKPAHFDSTLYYVREGIVIIPKGTIVPDNTTI